MHTRVVVLSRRLLGVGTFGLGHGHLGRGDGFLGAAGRIGKRPAIIVVERSVMLRLAGRFAFGRLRSVSRDWLALHGFVGDLGGLLAMQFAAAARRAALGLGLGG